jgi:hypothetical protein
VRVKRLGASVPIANMPIAQTMTFVTSVKHVTQIASPTVPITKNATSMPPVPSTALELYVVPYIALPIPTSLSRALFHSPLLLRSHGHQINNTDLDLEP